MESVTLPKISRPKISRPKVSRPNVSRTQLTAALDAELQQAVERTDVAGLAVAAADRHGLLYQGVFGLADIDSAKPLTQNAIFRIASMTKAVTATAALQLIEQGRLGLDDPVERYLPEFAKLSVFESFDPSTGSYSVKPAVNVVTVRQLFMHRAGFGYAFTSPIVRDFQPRDGESYAVGPLLFEPGTSWHYGTNTDWLGHVVEAISGATLEDYCRSAIFAPLRMTDTFFNVPADRADRVVSVTGRAADGSVSKASSQPAINGVRPNGGGGLLSTIGDYLRFTQAWLHGGTFEGARILSEASIAAVLDQAGASPVTMPRTAIPAVSADFSFINETDDRWGLGFLLSTKSLPGKRAAGSLSWGGLYNTYYWIDPASGVTGIIMMQLRPFADKTALEIYDVFERGVYRLMAVSK